jgi:hypothetical protein
VRRREGLPHAREERPAPERIDPFVRWPRRFLDEDELGEPMQHEDAGFLSSLWPSSTSASTTCLTCFHGISSPAVPEEDKKSARRDAEQRYLKFVEQVGQQYSGGPRFLDDLPTSGSTPENGTLKRRRGAYHSRFSQPLVACPATYWRPLTEPPLPGHGIMSPDGASRHKPPRDDSALIGRNAAGA